MIYSLIQQLVVQFVDQLSFYVKLRLLNNNPIRYLEENNQTLRTNSSFLW